MSEFPRACNVFGCVQHTMDGGIHCRIHAKSEPKDELQRGAVAGQPPEVGIADLLRRRDDAKMAAMEARMDKLEAVADAARARLEVWSRETYIALMNALAALDEGTTDEA